MSVIADTPRKPRPGLLTAAGIAIIVLSAGAALLPFVDRISGVRVVGTLLLAAGIVEMLGATLRDQTRFLALMAGAVTTLAGAMFLLNPVIKFLPTISIVTAWLIVRSLILGVTTLRAHGSVRRWIAISAATDLALGLLLLVGLSISTLIVTLVRPDPATGRELRLDPRDQLRRHRHAAARDRQLRARIRGRGVIQPALLAPSPELTHLAQIIQLAVAPVFLLAGIGAFLNVCAGRLARIVDRARALEPRILASRGAEHDRLIREVRLLDRRIRVVNAAIFSTVLAALIISAVVVLVFVAFLTGYRSAPRSPCCSSPR